MSFFPSEEDFLEMVNEIQKLHRLAMEKHVQQKLVNQNKEGSSLNLKEPKQSIKKERQKSNTRKDEHKTQEKQIKKDIEINGLNIDKLTTKLNAIIEDNQKYVRFLNNKKNDLENKKMEHERIVQAEIKYISNLKKYNESKLERSRLLFQAICNSSTQNIDQG